MGWKKAKGQEGETGLARGITNLPSPPQRERTKQSARVSPSITIWCRRGASAIFDPHPAGSSSGIGHLTLYTLVFTCPPTRANTCSYIRFSHPPNRLQSTFAKIDGNRFPALVKFRRRITASYALLPGGFLYPAWLLEIKNLQIS